MELHMCVYLCTKFQVYSIIVTSFTQGGGGGGGEKILPHPTSKRNPKKRTQIRVKKS